MLDIPKSFHLQYSRRQIQDRVEKLGREISLWSSEVWEHSHSDILTIPVLRGGIFFFADLVREISGSVEIFPAQTWAYEPGVNQVMRSDVKVRIDDIPAKGRAILLIDDICDSGKTLQALSEALRQSGALEVRSAVLIRRAVHEQAYDPEWVGFEYVGPEWFVGYGMEDSGRWRNLADIFVIQQNEEQ
ncbi:MAG: hypothetical protein KDD64_08935 [Bdellovibrionales bacterium]|nr:hypothetical protein [Bdellovibrionales bacterium]